MSNESPSYAKATEWSATSNEWEERRMTKGENGFPAFLLRRADYALTSYDGPRASDGQVARMTEDRSQNEE